MSRLSNSKKERMKSFEPIRPPTHNGQSIHLPFSGDWVRIWDKSCMLLPASTSVVLLCALFTALSKSASLDVHEMKKCVQIRSGSKNNL